MISGRLLTLADRAVLRVCSNGKGVAQKNVLLTYALCLNLDLRLMNNVDILFKHTEIISC